MASSRAHTSSSIRTVRAGTVDGGPVRWITEEVRAVGVDTAGLPELGPESADISRDGVLTRCD
jgi:hypothetical protein